MQKKRIIIFQGDSYVIEKALKRGGSLPYLVRKGGEKFVIYSYTISKKRDKRARLLNEARCQIKLSKHNPLILLLAVDPKARHYEVITRRIQTILV